MFSGFIRMSWNTYTKCFSFLTYDSIVSANGYSLLATYLDGSDKGDQIALTMGNSDTPCLCIFGRPYSFGHFEDISCGNDCLLMASLIGVLLMGFLIFFFK